MSKEKGLSLIVLNKDGTPNKDYQEKADKYEKLTAEEKVEYNISQYKFVPYPRYNLSEIFYDNLIKYFTTQLLEKYKVLSELSYKEQFYFIAEKIRDLEFLRFTKKNLEGIDISKNEFYTIHLDYLNIVKKHLDSIQPFENSQAGKAFIKPKSKKLTTAYKWQGNAEKELPELYSLMKDTHQLIASDTTLQQFTAIFTEQPVDSIKPIKWLDTNKLLAYFLDSVFRGQDWQSMAGNGKLFINKREKQLTANDFSVAKSNNKNYGHPKGYEMIDKILINIKTINTP